MITNYGFYVLVATLVLLFLVVAFSLKKFTPSEIVAIPGRKKRLKDNSGSFLRDENGKPRYTAYDSLHEGGYKFIFPWEDYFVLPKHPIVDLISTSRILTIEELPIQIDINVHYFIDTDNLDEAFNNFSYLSSSRSNKTDSFFEKISGFIAGKVQGRVPEIVGEMEIKQLTSNRENANELLMNKLADKFRESGLKLIDVSINKIDILDNAEVVNSRYEKKINEKIDFSMNAEIQDEKNKFEAKKDEIKIQELQRKQRELEEEYSLESAKIKIAHDLYEDKARVAETLTGKIESIERYEELVLLSDRRAKKLVDLKIKEIDLEISEIETKIKGLFNEEEVSRIGNIRSSMQGANLAASLIILLEKDPALFEKVFGKDGLTAFGDSITKHLGNIDSLIISDSSGSGSLGALNSLAMQAPKIIGEISDLAIKYFYMNNDSKNSSEEMKSEKRYTREQIKGKIPFFDKEVIKEEMITKGTNDPDTDSSSHNDADNGSEGVTDGD